jgi:hypothetical protein
MSIVRTCLLVLTVCACSEQDDPGRRLTAAECERAVAHAIALIEADPAAAPYAAVMKEHRAERVAECVATATLRDHRCLMNATTFTELGLCPMPGSGGAR